MSQIATGSQLLELQQHPKLIQEHVEKLRKERAQIIAELGDLQTQLQNLTQSTEALRTDRVRETSEWEQQKKTKEGAIDDLRRAQHHLSETVRSLEERKRHLEQESDAKQRALARLEQDFNRSSSSYLELTKQIEEAQSLWAHVIQNIEQDTTQLEQLKIQARALAQVKEKLQLTEQDFQDRSKKSEELRLRVAHLEIQESEMRNQVAACEARLEGFREQITSLEKHKNSLEVEAAKHELSKNHLDFRCQELKAEIEKHAVTLQKIQADQHRSTEEARTCEAKLVTLISRTEETQFSLQTKEKELQRLLGDISLNQITLQELRQQGIDREKRLDTMTDKLTGVSVEVRTRENQISQLRLQEDDLKQLLQNKTNELNQITLRLEEVSQLLSARSIEQDELSRQHTQLRLEYQKTDRLVKETKEVLGSLTGQRSELQNICQVLSQQVKEAQEQKNTIFYEESLAKQHLQARIEQTNLCKKEVEAAENKLHQLQTTQTEVEKNIFERAQHLKQLKQQSESQGQQLVFLETRLAELKKGEQQALQQCQSAETRLHKITQEAAATENKMSTQEQALVQLVEQEKKAIERLQELKNAEAKRIERLRILDEQEEQTLSRLETTKTVLKNTESKRAQEESRYLDVQARVVKGEAELDTLNDKHIELLDLVRRENENIMGARESLRELEELKGEKVREIQTLRGEIQQLGQKYSESQAKALEGQSIKLRTEAERTLQNLRRRLQSALTQADTAADEP